MLFFCILLLSSLSFACAKKEAEEKAKKPKEVSAAEQAFMQKNEEEYKNIKATTGMPVYVPDYLPSGLEIQRVTKIKATSVNPAYYEVDYSKGLAIYGSSNPDFNTDADFTGEFDLGGKHFEEHSYKNNPKLYQLLWHTGNATFMISVNLAEGISKDEVKKIAGSLRPVP
jgi:hypothetical protein